MNRSDKIVQDTFSLAITDSSNLIIKVVPLCQCEVTCVKIFFNHCKNDFFINLTLAGKFAKERTASTMPAANAAQFKEPWNTIEFKIANRQASNTDLIFRHTDVSANNWILFDYVVYLVVVAGLLQLVRFFTK